MPYISVLNIRSFVSHISEAHHCVKALSCLTSHAVLHKVYIIRRCFKINGLEK